MKDIRLAIEKSLPILTAATPGGFRILVLIFSGFFMSRENLAVFSTQYTLVVFFVMISGIGFSTILTKEMAHHQSLSIFFRYSTTSLVVGGGLAACALFVLSFMVPVPDLYSVIFLILATSLYQIFRNYLIFNRSFSALLLNDVMVAVFFVVFVGLFLFVRGAPQPAGMLCMLSVSYFLSVLVMLLPLVWIEKEHVEKIGVGFVSVKNTISSLMVGLSNSFSSGVGFLLPSFFLALGSDSVAVTASLSVTVFGVISALPRGIINNRIGKLSRMVLDRVYESFVVHDLKQKITGAVVFLMPCLSIAIVSYFYVLGDVDSYWVLWFVVVSLGFNVASGQLGVVESVLVNLCGYERLSLMFNALVFGLVCAVFLFIRIAPIAEGWVSIVYLIPVLLGGVNILRMVWFRRLVMRYFSLDRGFSHD